MIVIHNKTLKMVEAAETIYDFDALGYMEGEIIRSELSNAHNVNSPLSVIARNGDKLELFYGTIDDVFLIIKKNQYVTRIQAEGKI